VAVQRIFHGQRMQAELPAHLFQFGGRGIGQRHPDKAAGPLDIVADVGDGNVRQLGPVFVGDAVDQHGNPLVFFVPGIVP
jgi:hypothetical protein